MRAAAALVCAWTLLVSAATAGAQGVQSGILRGTVTSQDGLSFPGATVSITSPALQGERLATTEENGGYTFRGLPPGDYDVVFSVPGMKPVQRRIAVPLGGVAEVDATLEVAGVQENVQVVADRPTVLTTPTVGANYRYDEIDRLPTGRTLAGVANLAPGLTSNAPNNPPTEGQFQVVVNGAPAFDNVFMLNGVDVNDNIFGWPQNVFIEDAIAETQVLTSGISAEYGRFSGGVINAITKSGGNAVSGSYRLNLGNDAWSTRTPFEADNGVERVSDVNAVHEATVGGPILRDRLWYFAAGRLLNAMSTRTLPFTGIPYETTDDNKRGEAKMTGTIGGVHTIQGSVLGNPREQTNQPNFSSGLATIDPFALSDKTRPNHLFVMNYRGPASPSLFLEAQYSQQHFQTDQGGGSSTAIVDSPFITGDFTGQYNAPYFDATDPDERNNRQLTGSAAYFTGRHDLKVGYEWFRGQHVGGNSQSSTGAVFVADYATDAAGNPVLDAGGRLQPRFVPGETLVFTYFPSRGAVLNIDHNSFYAQDHWRVNRHLTADLGFRFEHVRSEASGGVEGVNAPRLVPRLALAYDPRGDGRYVVHSTYAHYSGRYNDAIVGFNSPVGNPIEVDGVYAGPAGQGRGFAPGFDLENYTFEGIFASFPSANVFFDPDLKSSLTREWTASFGAEIGDGGVAQVTYVWRHATDLVEDFIDRTTGTTHVVDAGQDLSVTNREFRNTDLARRDYQGLLLQGRYTLRPAWTISGHWTVQLENEGNYEPEAPSQILTTPIGDYPEIFTAERHYPTGRLQNFQRHKVDIWSVYQLDMGRAGRTSFSGLWRYNSARVYSLRATSQGITAVQRGILNAAGYPDAPAQQTVFFSDLGSESFAGYGVVDASVHYDVPVLRSMRPWIELELYNLFDNQKLIAWNTTIRQDATTPTDALGLRTGYTRGALFGQPTGPTSYPTPFAGQTGGRTMRIALGLRF